MESWDEIEFFQDFRPSVPQVRVWKQGLAGRTSERSDKGAKRASEG